MLDYIALHNNILYEVNSLDNYTQFSPSFYQSTRPHAIIEYSQDQNSKSAIGFSAIAFGAIRKMSKINF